MSKAVLVMDMPDYCNDCYARHMSQSGSFCRAAKEYLQPKAKRPDWCPLRELPDEKCGAWTVGMIAAYNKYLSEVLERKE